MYNVIYIKYSIRCNLIEKFKLNIPMYYVNGNAIK